MILLLASLFFTTPAPLDLPRAEAYLVKDGESRRLEDRYNPFDLWMFRAVIGRWFDDDRTFVLSRMDSLPPAEENATVVTRVKYAEGVVAADVRNPKHLRRMVDCLSPVEPGEKFGQPRQLPRGYKDVRYCQGTNSSVIVCAFLPERGTCWYLATWELAADDDFDEKLEVFEHEFLDELAWQPVASAVEELVGDRKGSGRGRHRKDAGRERELLRDDLKRSVAAYPDWHESSSDDFEVIDDLAGRGFVESLTNSLVKWRSRYSEVMPSPISGSNVLAAARIYADREDYLDAAGEEMGWTAAYWNPLRREIVACLPQGGERELLKTMRHEAFHQYLSYATAMTPVSPWLNEGYAQYFEDEESTDWGMVVTPQMVEKFAAYLPALFDLDYRGFYAGTDAERRMKYKLAWSIAVFIEKGAGKVRFEPFKNLKRDYIAALLESMDMRSATASAFGSSDRQLQFITEWKRFWVNH